MSPGGTARGQGLCLAMSGADCSRCRWRFRWSPSLPLRPQGQSKDKVPPLRHSQNRDADGKDGKCEFENSACGTGSQNSGHPWCRGEVDIEKVSRRAGGTGRVLFLEGAGHSCVLGL